MTPEVEALRWHLQKTLSLSRYDHSVRTAETARWLSGLYGEDPDKGYLAGLVHDMARELPVEEVVGLALGTGEPVTPEELCRPVLLHGRAAVGLLVRDWGITDRDILDAVTYHTVGSPKMGQLGKILYVADYIEPGREYHRRVEHLDPAVLSLDRLLAETVVLIRGHLVSRGRWLAPEGEALYTKLKEEGLIREESVSFAE